MLWNNPSVDNEYLLLSFFNKEAGWLITWQAKVRQNNQAEDIWDKKGRV